jgi:RNA polymerase sigma-70 factor (ECF subfamily)
LPRDRNSTAKSATPPRVSVHPSDRELIEGIKGGSEAHFTHLYDRYFQRIYSFVYLRMRNRADAEEVVQETFTAVYRSVEAYRGQSSLAAWIYGIAKNTINNQIRRARAQAQRVEKAEAELTRGRQNLDACTPEERLTLSRCEAALRESLESVGEWHAEAFVLRHFEDLSIDEIAQRVSRSNDAVRSSLYRMKKLLVEAIDNGAAPV